MDIEKGGVIGRTVWGDSEIKSVALALPTYTFSIAAVPMTVCKQFDSTIRRFWWNPKKDKGNYLAWKSWESLCQTKEAGGLGFRASKMFNQALLAKFTWWISFGRDSLCRRALRSKYKVDDDWLGKDPCKNASPLWKAIEKLRAVVKKGACYIVGDGTSIDMWKDLWVPWLEGFTPIPLHPNLTGTPMLVSNHFDPVSRLWKIDVLKNLVDPTSLAAILKIMVPAGAQQDRIIWTLNPSGCFTVKSAITSCLSPNTTTIQPNSLWQQLWKLKLH
uniref:Reverse transcriptase zinc-binding domain-containing protein n=1 Tax=Fagus sylvatica TaxID=28930 RepID=A0A2N9JAV2_FAGSY